MAECTAVTLPNGSLFFTPTNKELSALNRRTGVAGSALVSTLAPDATFTWTTEEIVDVTHAAATCTITLPTESAAGLAAWPVGVARTLRKRNTSANVIAFAALTNVGFNLAAVNTAITTLINSAVIPGVATRFPVWTIYRESAISYLFIEGV
jgi:hypothetical protein